MKTRVRCAIHLVRLDKETNVRFIIDMGKGEETRKRIIARAASEAAAAGLNNLSIGSLAAGLKMSKSGLFAHFGSKESLQRAALEHVVEGFVREVIQPAMREPTGLAKLERLLDRLVHWDIAVHPDTGCPVIAFSFELDDRPGPLRDYLSAQQRKYVDFIAKLVERVKTEGDFRPDVDASQFAFDLYGIQLGYNYYSRMLEDADAKRHARNAVKRLVANARS